MARTRAAYPAEFRQQLVELFRSGRTPGELAREFEPTEQTIRSWIQRAQVDGGCGTDVASSSEREELQRLRRENKRLRTEREILSKATAWFAREADSASGRSSNS
jgi:transposase